MNEKSKRRLVMIGFLLSLPFLLIIGSKMSEYLENREKKKAEMAEWWRREHLSSDERLAEDAKRARETERQAAQAKALSESQLEDQKKTAGLGACLDAWRAQLRDPGSAVVERMSGGMNEDGYFYAEINGRAKNGFGGYVQNSSGCKAEWTGASMKVISIFPM